MADFLLPREHRKRKRAIYARTHKALADLTEALRDMREFYCDITPLYQHLGDEGYPDIDHVDFVCRNLRKIRLTTADVPVDDILSVFNNVREEI